VGGLIGHCVSPQPWREIDAHGHKTRDLGEDPGLGGCTSALSRASVRICYGFGRSVLGLQYRVDVELFESTDDAAVLVQFELRLPVLGIQLAQSSVLLGRHSAEQRITFQDLRQNRPHC